MSTKAKNEKKETKRRIPPLTIRDAVLIYRNFSGSAKRFNAKGLRNFNVVMDIETGEMLKRDGWNIKFDEPREEGDHPRARLKVNVRFDIYPPTIWLVTNKGKTKLDEESVDLLDSAEIKSVDMMISASTGLMRDSGEEYVKAYLQKMFVTLDENDLEFKYANVSQPRHEANEED